MEKRKRAFNQSGPGAMTQWQTMMKREAYEKRHQWEQGGDFDVARRRGQRMAKAQQQKADLLTRRMYLACRKRDMMSGAGDDGIETEEDRLEVMRMADQILREEEGLRDAGFVNSLGSPHNADTAASLLPEKKASVEGE